jgi:hypothetical protein
MLHLAAAAELVAGGDAGHLLPGADLPNTIHRALVISLTVNGGCCAAVVGRIAAAV